MTNLEGLSIAEVKPVGAKLSDWIFILICAVIILFDSRPWEVMQIHHVILLAMISSSVFLLLWWSDRYEREPTCSILWALAWANFYFLLTKLPSSTPASSISLSSTDVYTRSVIIGSECPNNFCAVVTCIPCVLSR